ncbi:hypothetical protein LINPERPRIM_LOCUS38334 [Linum perenne]
MANWLWGNEGEIVVSSLSKGFFFFEFASESLCNWVIRRSWHIHQAPIILRKWYPRIALIDFSSAKKPKWVVFNDVSSALITTKGVGWMASQ